MKKTPLYLLSMCAVASAAPYYLPTPPGGGLTPYDWQPDKSLEGLYAIGARHTPDTGGFRCGLQLFNTGTGSIRHEFTASVAPQWGSGHRNRYEQRARQNIFLMPATMGYTLNINLAGDLFLSLGGRAGWAWGHYKEHSPAHRESGSFSGFSFSAGAGLKYQCSERLFVQLGYEFGRTYANTRHDDTWGQHIISAGFSWRL